MSPKKPSDVGTNRTGIATSPIDSKLSIEGANAGGFTSRDEKEASRMRALYARESGTIGSAPPPATVRGAVKALGEALVGKKATVLVDKLAERLAFERTGTRLYEALIVKLGKGPTFAGGPVEADLRHIQREEMQHAELARRSLESLGGDPTALTPSADVVGVMGSGILKVVSDPRMTLGQSLEAMLVAELADESGWELLVELARGLGHTALATELEVAQREEEQHVAKVRAWVAAGVQAEAGAKAA